MSLKNRGRERHKTFIKCDICKNRVEIIEEDIISYEGYRTFECTFCGGTILLNLKNK